MRREPSPDKCVDLLIQAGFASVRDDSATVDCVEMLVAAGADVSTVSVREDSATGFDLDIEAACADLSMEVVDLGTKTRSGLELLSVGTEPSANRCVDVDLPSREAGPVEIEFTVGLCLVGFLRAGATK